MSRRQPNPGSLAVRFPWQVIAPFLVVVVLMAVMGIAGTYTLAAVRAYLGGESLWSKGQKDAVVHLVGYTASRDEADFDRFRAALRAPLGDRVARVELQRAQPDYALARQGFLDGGNHPDDIDGMIWLFRTFRHVGFMADAIEIWREGDEQIAALDGLAEEIRRAAGTQPPDTARLQVLTQRLKQQNDNLTGLSQRFAATLGTASRLANRLVLGVTLLLGLALAWAAVALSLRTLRRRVRAEQALRASEERLQRALDASGLALWDYDVRSGEVYLSESWAQALGEPPKVTRTSFAALISLVPESELPALQDSLVAALKDPQAVYHVEHRVRKPDGQWLWNLSEGRVVERDAWGRALRMVGTNRDITERKLAEAARRHLEAQLRESQKMEAIGTLAGGIAHDFNNILGAILGNLALARDELGAGHTAGVSLDQSLRAAQRARCLVQQILAFSRNQPQELLNRPLRPLVDEALGLMRSTLPAGVAIAPQLTDAPLHVLADSTQMQQVLINLCTNAWHALHGAAGHIVVGLEALQLAADPAPRPGGLPPGDYAHLWVRDDGCGMDSATLARIFEPFFTTKPVGRGTGLGLSVVHGIVAAHGGAISVQSQPGQGSTFHVYFPCVAPVEAGGPPSDFVSFDPGPAATAPGVPHVLYIDDDEVMLLLVERLLGRLGYRVTCCQDPHEAIALVRRQPQAFDLVVSDFNMPQCSGLDVACEVARLRPDLPVIISSGHVTQELRADMQRNGVKALIQKENTIEELGSAVRRVLQAA